MWCVPTLHDSTPCVPRTPRAASPRPLPPCVGSSAGRALSPSAALAAAGVDSVGGHRVWTRRGQAPCQASSGYAWFMSGSSCSFQPVWAGVGGGGKCGRRG
eukprot:363883-Chlamydomonas_euryale.AAC.6